MNSFRRAAICRQASVICAALAILFVSGGPCRADWSTQLPPHYVAAATAKRSNIFFAGDAVQYTLATTGVSSYDVRDYYGQLVESGPHDPASNTLGITTSKLGWYKVYLYGDQDQGAPWHTVVGGSTFVIVRSNPNFPPLAAPNAQAGWYPDSDDQLLGFIGRGPQRLYVYDASNPAASIQFLDLDLAILKQNYLPYDPVRHRVLAIDFPNGTADTDGVRQIVEHFQNDVQYYEGRNEPNSGDSVAFASEERAFADVVKGVNPSLKVLGPSIVSIDPSERPWIYGFLSAGGGQAIDAFAFHAYNCLNGDLWLARQTLSDLQFYLLAFGGLSNEEIWQTEQGYAAAYFGAYLPRLQGRWTMLQMMVYEQNGIPKEHNMLWYDKSHGYWDSPSWIENDDGSLNPGAPLMRIWSEELYGTTFASAYDFGSVGNNLYVGSLFQGPGKTMATFMSAGDPYGQVTLSVQGGTSLHTISPFGQASDLPVVGGTVVLPVSELPVYVELAAAQQIAVVPVNYGVNLAQQAGVTITADGSAQCPLGANIPNSTAKIHDGLLQNWYYNFSDSSYPWMSNVQQFPAAVEIDLPQVQSVTDVIIYAGTPWQYMSTLLDYDLQYWNGSAWTTIEHVSEPTNTFPVYTPTVNCTADSFFSDRWIFPHHFAPIVTGKLRLMVNAVTWGGSATEDVVQANGQGALHQIVLREVEIYNRPATLPAIQTSPASQVISQGGNVTLSVAATGDPLQYQWQYNGAAIAGATGSTLTLSNVTVAQQGAYGVVVSNAAGSVTSASADLTVVLSFQNWLDFYFGRPRNTRGVDTPTPAGLAPVAAERLQSQNASVDSTAPNSDPDGDGVPNLLEYVFGTNPTTGMSSDDTAKLPHLSTETLAGVRYFVFAFNKSSHATVTLTLEGCTNLGGASWQTVVPDITETTAPDPVTLDQTVTYKIRMDTRPVGIFRLRASL